MVDIYIYGGGLVLGGSTIMNLVIKMVLAGGNVVTKMPPFDSREGKVTL